MNTTNKEYKKCFVKDNIAMTAEECFNKYPDLIKNFYKTIVELISERENIIITYNLYNKNSVNTLTLVDEIVTVGK